RHSVTSVGDSGALWYSGTSVATRFDEEKPGFALAVRLEPDARPSVEELCVGGWIFCEPSFVLGDVADVECLAQWLADQPTKERTVIYLTLQGTLSVGAKARLDEVLHDFSDNYASLRVHERTSALAVMPDGVDAETLGLTGYARRAWDELADEVVRGGAQAQVAAGALSLLYRLSNRADP
ncbi:MAG: hypothetical protein ACR2RL_26775, partial [Gammaproteobacteria bacterium]